MTSCTQRKDADDRQFIRCDTTYIKLNQNLDSISKSVQLCSAYYWYPASGRHASFYSLLPLPASPRLVLISPQFVAALCAARLSNVTSAPHEPSSNVYHQRRWRQFLSCARPCPCPCAQRISALISLNNSIKSIIQFESESTPSPAAPLLLPRLRPRNRLPPSPSTAEKEATNILSPGSSPSPATSLLLPRPRPRCRHLIKQHIIYLLSPPPLPPLPSSGGSTSFNNNRKINILSGAWVPPSLHLCFPSPTSSFILAPTRLCPRSHRPAPHLTQQLK